jgi:hypothetical protein
MADSPLKDSPVGRTLTTLERLRGMGSNIAQGAATGFGTSFTEGAKAAVELLGFAIPDVIEKPTVSALDKATKALTFGSEEAQKDLSYKIGSGLGNIASFFVPSTAVGKGAQVLKFGKATKAIEAANLVGAAAEGENLIKLGAALKGAGFGKKAVQEAVEVAAKTQKISPLSAVAAANKSATRAATATTAAFGSLLESGEAADRARDAGVSEGKVYAARLLGLPIGALEGLSNSRFLKSFGASFTKKVGESIATQLPKATLTGLQKTAFEVFKNSGIEGLEEWSQNTAQNLVSKGLYKPDQELFAGSGEAAMLGAITGGIFDVSVRGIGRAVDAASERISKSKPVTPEQILEAQKNLDRIIEEENRTFRTNSININMLVGLAKLNFLKTKQYGKTFNKKYIEKFKEENLNKIAVQYNLKLDKIDDQFKKLSPQAISAISTQIDELGGGTDGLNAFLAKKHSEARQEVPLIRGDVYQTNLENALDAAVYGPNVQTTPTQVLSDPKNPSRGKFLNQNEWYAANKNFIENLFNEVYSNREATRGLSEFERADTAKAFLNKFYEKEVLFKKRELESNGKKLPKPADPVIIDKALKAYLNQGEETATEKKTKKDEEQLNLYVNKFSKKIQNDAKQENSENGLIFDQYQNNLDLIDDTSDELKELNELNEATKLTKEQRKRLDLIQELPENNKELKKRFINKNKKAFASTELRGILGTKDVANLEKYLDQIFDDVIKSRVRVSEVEEQEEKIPTIPQSEFIPPEDSDFSQSQESLRLKRLKKFREIAAASSALAAVRQQNTAADILKDINENKSKIEKLDAQITEKQNTANGLVSVYGNEIKGRQSFKDRVTEIEALKEERAKLKVEQAELKNKKANIENPERIAEREKQIKSREADLKKLEEELSLMPFAESEEERQRGLEEFERGRLRVPMTVFPPATSYYDYVPTMGVKVEPEFSVIGPTTDRKTGEKYYRVSRNKDYVGGRYASEQDANNAIREIKEKEKETRDNQVKKAREDAQIRLEVEREDLAALRKKEAEILKKRREKTNQRIQQMILTGQAITDKKGNLIFPTVIGSEKRPELIGKERTIYNPEQVKKLIYDIYNKKELRRQELEKLREQDTPENLFKQGLITEEEKQTLTKANKRIANIEALQEKANEEARQKDKTKKATEKKVAEPTPAVEPTPKVKRITKEPTDAEKKAQREAERRAKKEARAKAKSEESALKAKKKADEEAAKAKEKADAEALKAKQKADAEALKAKKKADAAEAKEQKKKDRKAKIKAAEDSAKQAQAELNNSVKELNNATTEEGSQKSKNKVRNAKKKIKKTSQTTAAALEDIEQQREESSNETGSPEDVGLISNPTVPPAAPPTPPPSEPTRSLTNAMGTQNLPTEAEINAWAMLDEQERMKRVGQIIDDNYKRVKNVFNKFLSNTTALVENMYAHLDRFYSRATEITSLFKTLPSYGANVLKAMVNVGMDYNEQTGSMEVNEKEKGFMQSILEIGSIDKMNADQQGYYYIGLADWLSRNTEIQRIKLLEEYNKEAEEFNKGLKEGDPNRKELVEIFYRKSGEKETAEQGYQEDNEYHFMSRFKESDLQEGGINQIFDGIPSQNTDGLSKIIGRDSNVIKKEFEKINDALMRQNREVLKFAFGTGIIDKKLFDELSARKFYVPFITIKERSTSESTLDSISKFIIDDTRVISDKSPVLFAAAEGGLGSIKTGKEQLGLLLNNWQHMLQYGADNRAKMNLVLNLINVPLPTEIAKRTLKGLSAKGEFKDLVKFREKLKEFETKTVVEKANKTGEDTIMVSIDGVKTNYKINDGTLLKIAKKEMYSEKFFQGSQALGKIKGLYTSLITIEPNFRLVNVLQGLPQAIYTANVGGIKGVRQFINTAYRVWKLGFRVTGNTYEDLQRMSQEDRELYKLVINLSAKGGLFTDVLTTSVLDQTISDSRIDKNENLERAQDLAMKSLGSKVGFDLTFGIGGFFNRVGQAAAWLEHGARTASYLTSVRNQEYINKVQDYSSKFTDFDMKINNALEEKLAFEHNNSKNGVFSERSLSKEQREEYKKLKKNYKDLITNRIALRSEANGFMAEPVALARTVDIDFSNRSLNKIQNFLFTVVPFWRSKAVSVSRIVNVAVDSVLPQSVIEGTKQQIDSEFNVFINSLNEKIKDAKILALQTTDENQKASFETEIAELEQTLSDIKSRKESDVQSIDRSIKNRIGRARVFRNVLYAHIALAILQDVAMRALDDDSEENTPKYIRYNYFRIPTGTGTYINVPMTFGVGAIARTIVDAAKVMLKPYWEAIDPNHTIPEKSKLELMGDLFSALVNEQEATSKYTFDLDQPVAMIKNILNSRMATSPLTGASYLPKDIQDLEDRSSYKGSYLNEAGPVFELFGKLPIGKSPIEYKRWASDFLGTFYDSVLEPANMLFDSNHDMLDYRNAIGSTRWAQAAMKIADSLLIGSLVTTEKKEIVKFYGPAVDQYRQDLNSATSFYKEIQNKFTDYIDQEGMTLEKVVERINEEAYKDLDNVYEIAEVTPRVVMLTDMLKNLDTALADAVVMEELKNLSKAETATNVTKIKRMYDYEKLKQVRFYNRQTNFIRSSSGESITEEEKRKIVGEMIADAIGKATTTPKEVLGF